MTLGSDPIDMGAIKHTMELIAHSLCLTNSALAKVAREDRPGKPALLNGQSIGPKPELHQSPKLADAHWQVIVGLKALITRPAKSMMICAKLTQILEITKTSFECPSANTLLKDSCACTIA